MASLRRYTDVALLVLGLFLFPAFVGCNGLGLGVSAQSKQKAAARSESPAAEAGALADDRVVFATVQEKDSQGPERCVWTRNVDSESSYRWRYPRLEAVLAQTAEQRPNLTKLLEDRDPKVAFNAAIALGRRADYRAVPVLSKAVGTTTLPLPMRCAAAETLGECNNPTSGWPKGDEAIPDIQKLIDRYGRYSPKSPSSYVPELHEELLRGLARRIDAADDKRFLAAFKSPRAEVRVEALKAWAASKQRKLPQQAADLRTDVDPRVRAAALAAIVSQKHPQALEYLRQGLTDLHFTVRKAAIDGLGALGGDEALSILKEQFKDRSDGIRAEAVRALAAMRDEPSLLTAAGDKSWRVRASAAEALAYFPGNAAETAIEKLLDDPSGEVQMAAVRVLEKWPLERSGPILLAAMGKPAFSVRKAATAQLARRWPPGEKFSADTPAESRAQLLQELSAKFRSRFGVVQTSGSETISDRGHKPRSISPQMIAQVETVLETGDTQALFAYGPELIDALEALRFERKRTLPEAVYRVVLPRSNPIFAVLYRFSSRDAVERRRAAQELQALSAQQPCGRLALDRLSQLMAAESDDLVWLGVLQAVSNEIGEETANLAYIGLSHPSSEVRRRACAYLAAHPDRRHAPMLLPALEDSQPRVVCTAVKALAACGLENRAPLKRLLNSKSEEIQLAAATALVQWSDAAGKPALERLSYANDPRIRARAARAMGENPDPAFVPPLIRLLGDEATVSRTALASLSQVAGEDISQPANQPPVPTAERISRWKRWYDDEKGAHRSILIPE